MVSKVSGEGQTGERPVAAILKQNTHEMKTALFLPKVKMRA